MASREGSREVPDSEDEPMTSSPVNTSDVVADKLSVTAPVPPQDAQGALQEAARPHQATSENVANAGDRIGGLDVDQKNASIDHDVLSTNIQPETTTATESADIATASTNPKHQLAPNHELIIEPAAMNPAKTDTTIHTPEIHLSDEQMDARNQPKSAIYETAILQTEQQSSFEGIHESISNAGEEISESARQATNSSTYEADGVRSQEPSASQKVSGEFIKTRDEKASNSEPTSRTVAELPTQSHDIIGNENTLRTSMSESVEAQSEGSGGTHYAKHAITVPQEMPPNKKPEKRSSETASKDDKSLSNVPMAASTEDAAVQDTNETSVDASNVDMTDEQTSTAPSVSATATQSSFNSQSSTPSQPPSTNDSSTSARTPQEITIAELKAQKSAMLANLATLPAIQVLMEENASSNAVTSDGDDEPTESDIMAAANKIVQDHIKLLHEYNELKDVGQGLMGLIADQRGVRIVEVQEEFGIDARD